MNLLLVGLGGALGSVARYGFYRIVPAPWGTFGVNVVGGFLMGLLFAWLTARGGSETHRLLLGVGVIGGFTTFSAFSLDAVVLAESGEWRTMLVYVAASVLLSIGALVAGLGLGRSLVP